MGVINIGSATDLEKTSYVRDGLPWAKPKLIYSQFGQSDRVKKRDGHTRQWFRLTKPGLTSDSSSFDSAQYVKNTTGASPTWSPADIEDTTVTAQADFLFGQGHEWNEGVEYTSFADLPKELRGLNWQHAAECVETEIIATLKAVTSVAYANNKTSRNLLAAGDEIDLYDLFTVCTNLRNNDAMEIRGLFRAMCSANVIEQLFRDSVFQNAIQFQKKYMFTGTIAEIFGIGFSFSSMAPSVADSGSNNAVSNIEQTIITGANAYGITKWMMNDFDIIYTPPGGHGDEWANKHKLTWKHVFKSVILNANWIYRLETARKE